LLRCVGCGLQKSEKDRAVFPVKEAILEHHALQVGHGTAHDFITGGPYCNYPWFLLHNIILLVELYGTEAVWLPMDRSGHVFIQLVNCKKELIKKNVVVIACKDPLRNPLHKASMNVKDILSNLKGPQERIDAQHSLDHNCAEGYPFVQLKRVPNNTPRQAVEKAWDKVLKILRDIGSKLRPKWSGCEDRSSAGKGKRAKKGAAAKPSPKTKKRASPSKSKKQYPKPSAPKAKKPSSSKKPGRR
jgi:hypothetical protein